MARNQKDWQVRSIAEATPGVTPGTPMLANVWTSLNPQGDGPDRSPSGGVSPDQQPFDNPATYTETGLQGQAPSMYDHHRLYRAGICGAADYAAGITVTGTDISSVDTGNKLVKAAGTWGGLAQYDIVEVSGAGLAGTPYVALVSGVVTATDLPLSVLFKDLADAAAGGSVTVKFVARLRVGTLFPTFTFELWQSKGLYGDVFREVGVSSWDWSFDIPNAPQESFNFLAGQDVEYVTAQLANTTTAAPARKVHNSNVHFGYKTLPAYGGQFRYGGTVYAPSALRIKSFKHEMKRSVKTSGAAGDFGPKALYTDGLLDLMVTLEIYRDSPAAEVLLADRRDPETVTSIGFAMIDPAGQKFFRYYPGLQPMKGTNTGLSQDNEDFITIPYKANASTVPEIGMFQDVLLG